MDIARLGLAVDSAPVDKASASLDRFEREAKQAETSAKQFGTKATGAAGQAAAANDNVARSATLVGGAYRTALRAVTTFALTIGSGFAFAAMVQGARDFSAALAEVSTLLPTLDGEMQVIERNARRMGKEFGTGATAQVSAYYQAISAGAGDAAAATQLLESANRVAVGGVTDVTTAVDALTTATNAYRASGLSAAEAADALFVGMRAGKTTIGELAGALGQVIPIASGLGVSFDELVAATSALRASASVGPTTSCGYLRSSQKNRFCRVH